MKFVSFLLCAATLFLVGAPLPAGAQDDGPPKQRILVQEEAKTLPTRAKRFALVIGVDEYQDRQIAPLSGAANDARSLAQTLISHAGFPEENVIVLATGESVERQPVRGNILRWLSNLAGVIPKDGLLLVSFAGHGIERNERAYLLPADAQTNGDIALVEETAVSVARLKERIKATGVRQVLVILDACRNNPSGRGAAASGALTSAYAKGFRFDVRNKEVQAFATLYSTEVGQTAYEYTEKRQGYFTHALVEGLTGKAANERGEVTLAALVKYVQTEVPKRVKLNLGPEKDQKPFAVIEGYRADDLVVAVARRAEAGASAKSEAEPPLEVERVAPRGALVIVAKQSGIRLQLDGRLIGEAQTDGEAFRIKNQPAGRVVTVTGKADGKPEIVKRIEIQAGRETEIEIGYDAPRRESSLESRPNGRRKNVDAKESQSGGASKTSSSEASSDASVKNELQLLYNRFGDALRARNVKLLETVFTSDFISKGKDGRETLFPAYLANASLMLAAMQSITRCETIVESVETTDDGRAVVVGRYVVTGTLRGPDGAIHSFSFSGRERLTAVKTADGWRCRRSEALEDTSLLDGKPIN